MIKDKKVPFESIFKDECIHFPPKKEDDKNDKKD